MTVLRTAAAALEPPLAIIGILGPDNRARRYALRTHWAASAPSVHVRFALSMHDIVGAAAGTGPQRRRPFPDEPDDVDLLDCLGQTAGRPVVMLALADAWWRHAAMRYAWRSNVRLIGRADDDVLVNPTFLGSLLEATAQSLGSQPLVVGQFQWYSWDAAQHRPRGWGMGPYNARRHAVRDEESNAASEGRCTRITEHRNKKCKHKCRQIWEADERATEAARFAGHSGAPHTALNSTAGATGLQCTPAYLGSCYHRDFRATTDPLQACTGPFPFAIGPLQFLTPDLVRNYARSQRVVAAVANALDSRLDRKPDGAAGGLLGTAAARQRGRYLPYDEKAPEATHLFEDVFLGYALCAGMLHDDPDSVMEHFSATTNRTSNLTYVSLPFAKWDVPCNGRDGSRRALGGCLRGLRRHKANWSEPSGQTAVVHHVSMSSFMSVIDRDYVSSARFQRCRFSCNSDAHAIWIVNRLRNELPCGTGQTWCKASCV